MHRCTCLNSIHQGMSDAAHCPDVSLQVEPCHNGLWRNHCHCDLHSLSMGTHAIQLKFFLGCCLTPREWISPTDDELLYIRLCKILIINHPGKKAKFFLKLFLTFWALPLTFQVKDKSWQNITPKRSAIYKLGVREQIILFLFRSMRKNTESYLQWWVLFPKVFC